MVKRVYWLHAEVFATVVTIFTVINCSDWSLLSHLHLYTVVLIFARKQVFFFETENSKGGPYCAILLC
jgi:hypothetical protein